MMMIHSGDDDGFFPFFSSLSSFDAIVAVSQGSWLGGIARPCNDDDDNDARVFLLLLFIVYSYVDLPLLCCIIV